MSPSSRIFLARSGNTYGPFTEEDIRKMREQGGLSTYTWIWTRGAQHWTPLDPPPPPPFENSEPRSKSPHPAHAPTEAQPQAPTQTQQPRPEPQPDNVIRAAFKPKLVPTRELEAACHDSRHIISGKLQRISDIGCELVCENGEGPAFGQSAPLQLNLLDPATGRSVTVSARLEGVTRKNGHWAYELRWDQCPEIAYA